MSTAVVIELDRIPIPPTTRRRPRWRRGSWSVDATSPRMNALASSSVYGGGITGIQLAISGSLQPATSASTSSSAHGRRTRSPSRSSTGSSLGTQCGLACGAFAAAKRTPSGRYLAVGNPRLAGFRPAEKAGRRPTLPGACAPSTIGAGGLNFSVRNGKRCIPAAMTAQIVEAPAADSTSRARTLKTP